MDMQSQPGQVMTQPPNIITVKDELYITDMMAWNLNAAKKAHFFAGQCNDQEISQALHKTAAMHEQHYNKLLNHLDRQATAANRMN
ncbi:hypothetical protein [Salsuginibacillus kocurii]|uniref:hypothetical protein n=1 Tax=Salsuginibacillus kocurii TaxID=427078 RepID=UPI00037A12C0|nr:hypothetical protein [Salsuginibacillus kocurii]